MRAAPPPLLRLLSAAVVALLVLNGVVLAQPARSDAGSGQAANGKLALAAVAPRPAAVADVLADAEGDQVAAAALPTPLDPAQAAQVAPAVPPAPVDVPAAPVDGTAVATPTRIRGVWVHVLDDVLLSRASIARMLDQVVAGGGNTVVVEVARRYDAYYTSAFLPRGSDEGFEPDLDVLAEVAAGARARGLSVHAWFTAMPAWTPETANNPVPANWTFTQHGRDVAPADSWLTFDAAGQPTDYLDPGHPAVQDLVVATAAELAAYDVDAVHVDYLRYPGAQYGYNPTAIGRFQAETGRTDLPAPDDPQFGDWRRQQTTDILRRMQDAVAAVDPSVGISAALIAWGDGPTADRPFEATPAWTQVYQPWPQWMAEGLVDVAMPMLYFRESRHASYHDNWTSYVAGLRQATGTVTAIGQGSWLNQVEESLAQIGQSAPLVDGEVLFSYQETATGQGPEALLGALGQSLWTPP